jgi:hypothetical protein
MNYHTVVESLEALALHSGDTRQHFRGIKHGLGTGKRVGGSRRWLALGESKAIGADAEALKISTGDVRVNFIAADIDFADLVDHLRASGLHLVADLGKGAGSQERWVSSVARP